MSDCPESYFLLHITFVQFQNEHGAMYQQIKLAHQQDMLVQDQLFDLRDENSQLKVKLNGHDDRTRQ